MKGLQEAIDDAVRVMEDAASDTEANGWDETPRDLRKAAKALESAYRRIREGRTQP